MTLRIIDLATGEETTREYTQEELDAMPAPDPKWLARQKLAEADAPFTPRRVREFMRLVLEDKAEAVAAQLGVDKDTVLASNPGYQFVKTFDDLAAEARAEL
jgi:hypothetical protein